MFELELTLDEFVDPTKPIHKRCAVRAVLLHPVTGQLLMEHTRVGDYKLPGGGVEEGETHQEALVRELMEETGLCNVEVLEQIGFVRERSIDSNDVKAYFEMDSYYYLCRISAMDLEMQELNRLQRLDDYEKDLAFLATFVDLEEAYRTNCKIAYQTETLPDYEVRISRERFLEIPWIERECIVLEELRQKLVYLRNFEEKYR